MKLTYNFKTRYACYLNLKCSMNFRKFPTIIFCIFSSAQANDYSNLALSISTSLDILWENLKECPIYIL